MSQVFEFPTQQARDWTVIERALLQILRRADMPKEVQAELLARMKAFTELLHMRFPFSVPAICSAEVSSEIERFSLALQERSNRLIMERLFREIEVLKLSGTL